MDWLSLESPMIGAEGKIVTFEDLDCWKMPFPTVL